MPPNYLGIHGVPGLIVAVGEQGTIRHYTSAHDGPERQESPTTNTLTSVYVESPSAAWAVGEDGTILRWNGHHWNLVAMAIKHAELHAVWSTTNQDVWIGGRHCLLHYQGVSVHAARGRAGAACVRDGRRDGAAAP